MSEWSSLMDYAVAEARTTRRRQRIYGFRLPGSAGWGYAVEQTYERVRNRLYAEERLPDISTRAEFSRIMAGFPNCAQRSHVGKSKRAIPSASLARKLADFLTKQGQAAHAYRCELSSPAIGAHMHLATRKKRRTRGR